MASAGAHTDERCRQPAFLPGPPPPEVESSSGSAKVSAAPSRAEPCHAAPSRATPRDACAAGCLCRAAPSRAEPCRLRCSPSPRVSLEGPREPAQPGLPAANLRAVRCGGCGAVRGPPGHPQGTRAPCGDGRFSARCFFFFNNYSFFICCKKYVVIIFAWVGGAQRCPHPPARLLRAPCAGRARRGRGEGGGGERRGGGVGRSRVGWGGRGQHGACAGSRDRAWAGLAPAAGPGLCEVTAAPGCPARCAPRPGFGSGDPAGSSVELLGSHPKKHRGVLGPGGIKIQRGKNKRAKPKWSES